MKFVPSFTPNNYDALCVLGYMIIVNKQVHSYQVDVLMEYLNLLHIDINETGLNDIIEGKEESITFATSLIAFLGENESIQRDIYYMLIVLSFVDNTIDGSETALINHIMEQSKISNDDALAIKHIAMEDADSIRSSNNILFERVEDVSAKKNILRRFINWIISFLRRAFGKETKKENSVSDIYYKSKIEKCAEVAKEDFNVVLPLYSYVLRNGQNCIDKLNKYKRSLSLKTGLSAEVANIVKIFVDALNNNVLEQSKLAGLSLAQKERTVPDFTISLIGRTKAGKSTLHAILTNQGYDKIGEGSQRTTRYNRVYQWNLLRLIDTPGIGSAEADGRTDDEIAESVLGESDVICFIIVDDSILKDVLDYIEKVAVLNKPIIILLNHKDNIRNEVKLKRFIENPSYWLTNLGESNLKGHINRIQKYADDRGFGALIRVFPVCLLAAQMSREKGYHEYRNLMWKNSNIDAFIDQLKIWISSAGTIKKSQTILDEAVHTFNKSKEQILLAQKPVIEQIERLVEQRESKINALKQTKTVTVSNVKAVLHEMFDNLATNEAILFAEEAYGQKGEIPEMWKAYLEKIQFEEDVKIAVESELNSFYRKADDTILDFFEDFYYSLKRSFEVGNIDIPFQFDFKSMSRLAGGVLGVAGTIVSIIMGISNPVGWVLTGAGILLGLSSSLFSSKEKNRQKAIDKVYTTIKDSIIEQSTEQINNTTSEIEEKLIKHIERINDLFSGLINGLKETIKISEQMTQGYETQIEEINRVYAWRIVQFLLHEDAPYSLEKVKKEIISVDRSLKGTIIIESNHNSKIDTKALDGIIAEKVIFK